MASTPGFGFGYSVLPRAYHGMGELDRAVAAAADQLRFSLNFPEGALALQEAYSEGDYRGAMRHAAETLEERSKTTHVGPLAIGGLYEYAGEAEKAIDWYEVGYQIAGPGVPYLGVGVKSPEVRSNPRFRKLMKDLKLDYWVDEEMPSGHSTQQ